MTINATTQPTHISDESWARFTQLSPADQRAALSEYNNGERTQAAFDSAVDAYDTSAAQNRYRGVTATSEGSRLNASAARFGRVIPMRTSRIPEAATVAINKTAGLSDTTGELALSARPGIIGKIQEAIS